MQCLVALFVIGFPRVALLAVWLFGGNYLERAFEHWVFPMLGFVFLPLTTIAFAYGMNSLGAPGHMEPLGWLLVALAAALDLGLIGSSRSERLRRRRDDD